MKTKILSILALLLMAVTGAVAQTDLETPLTLEAITDGKITITDPKSGMQYSKDGGSTKSLVTAEINVEAGDVVTFYGNGTSITSYDGTNINCDGECYIYGNIMSLVDENGFATATALTEEATFFRLFEDNSNLYSHPTKKLVLPATTLAYDCYNSMFSGCTSLTTAPELPATNLESYCYSTMFKDCTSLTIAPELPATDLESYCYYSMFENCTSLTTAPVLPAEDLEVSCYEYMFYDCTRLRSVTCLATNIEAGDATSYWLENVALEGTFIMAEGMGSWTTGVSGIPSGWTTTTDYVTLTNRDNIETPLSTYAGQTCWVNYTRPFTSGKPSTVCLPFAYTKKTGDGSFYAFTNIEKVGSDYVATMTEPISTTLTANKPYLYMPTGAVDFSGTYTIPATLEAGSTTSNGWTFKGNYENKTWTTAPTGTYGFSASDYSGGISQGQFVKVGTNVSIKPMRCYLVNESFVGAPGMNRAASAGEQLPATIKVRLINANGELTAIGSMQTKTGEVTLDGDAWYTLDGRRIDGKPGTKGIYINNNKKVIIK